MEVILLQKVANLGNIGDKVKVKPGYGRNFLLPQGKAAVATAANLKKFEERRAELEKLAADELESAKLRAGQLENFRLVADAPRRAARASCSARSARPTSPRRCTRPASASSAAKCAWPRARSAWWASTTSSCTCTPTSIIDLPVDVVAEE